MLSHHRSPHSFDAPWRRLYTFIMFFEVMIIILPKYIPLFDYFYNGAAELTLVDTCHNHEY